MRKPLERESGRYKQRLIKLDLIAKDTVENICNEYPDIDIIDLEFIFGDSLRFQFAMRLLKELEESAEEEMTRKELKEVWMQLPKAYKPESENKE